MERYRTLMDSNIIKTTVMKANKLKYIALSGALMLLTAFATISCDDANDWTTDSSYNRLFSVPKMSVSANATDAELTWSTTPGTEYYIIEISLDSFCLLYTSPSPRDS